MTLSHESLLFIASFCLLVSLLLAWLGALILYGKIGFLKAIFPASHQLIRAHIDYLLMTGLLVVTYYMFEVRALEMPKAIILATCIGALYNPFGFIVLAIKPAMANPQTILDKTRILVGFLPTTVGFGYAMGQVMMSFV